MLTKLLWVCAGGAVGSCARYLVSVGAAKWLGAAFPWGTLTVNLAGSFLLGLMLEAFIEGAGPNPGLRLAMTTGAMGGLTTYSTFNYEALSLLESGRWTVGLGYLAATGLGCLVAGGLGIAAGRIFAP